MGSGNLSRITSRHTSPTDAGSFTGALYQSGLSTDPNKPLAQPPPAPDLTDQAILQARRAQLNQLLGGRGRASTFLGAQPADYVSPLGKTLLGG